MSGWSDVNAQEIHAYMGLLILAGVYGPKASILEACGMPGVGDSLQGHNVQPTIPNDKC